MSTFNADPEPERQTTKSLQGELDLSPTHKGNEEAMQEEIQRCYNIMQTQSDRLAELTKINTRLDTAMDRIAGQLEVLYVAAKGRHVS